MGTMTLSVPDDLKAEMDKTDWVNWSGVARRAFAETLRDVKELEMKRKVEAIGGIDQEDQRVMNNREIKQIIRIAEKSKRKPSMTRKDMARLLESP